MAEVNTEKKPGFGEKVKRFFKDYKSEFFKIRWANPAETLNKFYLVLVAIAVIAIALWGLDWLFNWLFNQGLLSLAGLL